MSRLGILAINDEGFAFDPQSGESFTLNKTALCILKGLKDNKDIKEITAMITENFDISYEEEVEKDLSDFIEHLRIYQLI
ncbi:MAG: PqqD family protein [Cyanobacteriota bacterium]